MRSLGLGPANTGCAWEGLPVTCRLLWVSQLAWFAQFFFFFTKMLAAVK